ncbi:hypothetical protein VCRA2119O241_500005 [Vibrio crassostreae]|nr:hypothetical protein VCRA2119O241_500005 [Vibrio crassostreae]
MLKRTWFIFTLLVSSFTEAGGWDYEPEGNCAFLRNEQSSQLSVCIPISDGFVWAADLEIRVATQKEIEEKSLATKIIELNGTRIKSIYFLPIYPKYGGAFSIKSDEGKKFVLNEIVERKPLKFRYERHQFEFKGNEFKAAYTKVIEKYEYELAMEKRIEEEQSDAL